MGLGFFSSIFSPGDNSKTIFGKWKQKIGKIEAGSGDMKVLEVLIQA